MRLKYFYIDFPFRNHLIQGFKCKPRMYRIGTVSDKCAKMVHRVRIGDIHHQAYPGSQTNPNQ